MSRFHTEIGSLEEDGAFIEYKRMIPRLPAGMDPAEWIEALHREHWRTLDELRAAREATEGERLAKVFADLQFAMHRLKLAQTTLGAQRTRLGDVLGRTPTVDALKDVDGELRGILATLEEVVRG